MKISPAEYVQNVTKYTDEEKKNIALSMSPEEVIQLQSLLNAATNPMKTIPNNSSITPLKVSVPEQDAHIIYNKEYASRGSDETFSECARVFRAMNDKISSWNNIIEKLKSSESRNSKMGLQSYLMR